MSFSWEEANRQLAELAPRVLRHFPAWIQRDIDDIVQDSALKLFRANYTEMPTNGLLSRVLMHQAIDRLRASQRFTPTDLSDVAERPAERSDDERRAELWKQLQHALDRLPSEDRAVLLKFYRGKAKIQSLAREAGVSYSAMAVRLHRIKEKLRAALLSTDA